MIEKMYQGGKNESENPNILVWKKRGNVFLGTMHGVIGIVYMMLRGISIIGQQNFDPAMLDAL